MKKVNLLGKAEMKRVIGGNTDVENPDGEIAGTKYKCVYPTGESACLEYSTKPSCGTDYTGSQGQLKTC